MSTERTGRIIFLNGTSSSGKSSIAEELLRVLDTPYFHLAVDKLNAMRSRERTDQLSPGELAAVLRRTRAGFHRVVAGMADAGNDVVVDHVLSEPWRLVDCLEVLRPFDVVFVGVRCSAEELRRREQRRGDRDIGTAEAQVATVHAHGPYDVECDTDSYGPRECALQIAAYLERPHGERAFQRLRRSLDEDRD